MLNFCSLYSGSSGNCSFIETEHSKILVDAGNSAVKIEKALKDNSINISDIDAILVTHEHSDHIRSVGTLSSKYNIPVYASKETWLAMPEQEKKISSDCKKLFKVDSDFEINDLKIHSFKIPHDASNPCGFNFYHDKKKISLATDIGHITDDIIENLSKSSFSLLEANYDPNILKYSRYPYSLKQRIAGPNGHLSNTESGNLISILIKSGLSHAMLGHLSKENNFPELAYKTVVEELIRNHYDENSIHIDVAHRDLPSKMINIS